MPSRALRRRPRCNEDCGRATKGAATTATDAMKTRGGGDQKTRPRDRAAAGDRMVDVHETCAKAPNGAPGLRGGGANGCRGKGSNTGNPLDVRTAEKCDTTACRRDIFPATRMRGRNGRHSRRLSVVGLVQGVRSSQPHSPDVTL